MLFHLWFWIAVVDWCGFVVIRSYYPQSIHGRQTVLLWGKRPPQHMGYMFVRERQERGMCSTAQCLWRGVNSSDKWHGLLLLWGRSSSSFWVGSFREVKESLQVIRPHHCDECKCSGFAHSKLSCLFLCPNRPTPTLWVEKSSAWGPTVSDPVQITALLRFLPVIILAALIQLPYFYPQSGNMVLIILKSSSFYYIITHLVLTIEWRREEKKRQIIHPVYIKKEKALIQGKYVDCRPRFVCAHASTWGGT